MINFTYRTRRRILLLCFLLFCPAATGISLVWASTRALNDPTPYWQAHLSGLLGLDVELAGIELPRPHLLRLNDVAFREPESGKLVAKSKRMDVVVTRQTVFLSAREMEVYVPSLTSFADPLHDRVFRTNLLGNREVSLRVAKLQLHRAGGRLDNVQLTAKLNDSGLGPNCIARISLQDQQNSFAEFHLSRNRQPLRIFDEAKPAVSRLHVQTGHDGALPCNLVWPTASDLVGQDATFQGSIQIVWDQPGWRADLQGQLNAIDLQTFARSTSPYSFNGMGNVKIRQMQIINGVVRTARGSVSTGPGTIGMPLVRAAKHHLKLGIDRGVLDQERPAAFQRIGFDFSVAKRGLEITGTLGAPADGIIAKNVYGKTIVGDSPKIVPIGALKQTLVERLPAKDRRAKLADSMFTLFQGKQPWGNRQSVRLGPHIIASRPRRTAAEK